jgi:subtilisin family serine protease
MKRTILSLLLAASVGANAETLNLTPYNTSEYTADTIAKGKTGDDFLKEINASSAWARGYTGKGSLILIIDSGINANHREFAGSIFATRDFIKSKNGIVDVQGHGTGLAGIAAGNWDGIGMAGVAPDAQLAIAKVTDNTAFNFTQARNALKWGSDLGAIVANISANYTYDAAYLKNMYRLSDGVTWANKDPRYVGRFFMNENPNTWAAALSPNMVLVNSAGNSGRAYAEQPGTLATATDANGKLILGGRVIIAGAWDVDKDAVAGYSNRAGSICRSVVNGQCKDLYRVSDFYILAPGNAFTASKTGDAYNIQTGTSQAAAVVSGSVAVINQMWPTMKAENIVKLLMVTANKNIAGYNKEIHGQGLLDLERATRPVGALGIPTTGRVNKIALSGGFSTNTSGGLTAISSKLSSVMVTDDFERDYYVDMSKAANTKRARADFNPNTKANFYEEFNPYNKLNFYTANAKLQSGEYDFKFSANDVASLGLAEIGKTTKLNDRANVRVGFGMLNEQNTWVGNSISGALGQVQSSFTTFSNFTGHYDLNKHMSAFGSVWLGQTETNMQSTGLITNVSATQSYSWNVGLDWSQDAHSYGATLSQPVTVYQGTVNVDIPTGYNANGTVNYSKEKVSITPSVNEYDVGAYYKYRTASMNVIAYGEHQMNYLNQSGVSNNVVGLSLVKAF